jgi:hypothetical protein
VKILILVRYLSSQFRPTGNEVFKSQTGTANTLFESYRFCTPLVFSRMSTFSKIYSRSSNPRLVLLGILILTGSVHLSHSRVHSYGKGLQIPDAKSAGTLLRHPNTKRTVNLSTVLFVFGCLLGFEPRLRVPQTLVLTITL